ncbi:MAG: hypothetical protein ACP5OA_02645 [Candidatus Woesearchaeota archaeon]
MTLSSFLGVNFPNRPDRRLAGFTYEEYYARYERIKEYVEAVPEIKSNINEVFCHEYLGQKLYTDIMLLGRGATNNIYSVYAGSIPDGDNDISLALRVKRLNKNDSRFYKLRCGSGFIDYDFQLFSELNSFSDAFAMKMNPPYFTGLVEWKGPDRYSDGVVGFITEDVTKRKTLNSRIQTDILADFLNVTGEDGTVTQYFINSVMPRGYDTKIIRYGENLIKVDYK